MKVINIEGIDAVGKETVSKALEKRLCSKGFRVKRVSFPNYESNIGKAIKDVLMGSCGNAPDLDGTLMASLYSIDRLAYFKDNIKNLFETCDYLICDRSFYSNFMYQASKIYINNSNCYDLDILPAKLEGWMIRNNAIEINDTGLIHCEDIQTFVLTLSEEDSLKQLSNRKEKDTNELNRDYLNECKKFVNHMMSDKVVLNARNYLGKSITYANKIVRENAYANYIFNVHKIEVVHADNSKKIPSATKKNVDKIMAYLFEEEAVTNNTSTVATIDIDYKKHFSNFAKINCIIQSLYNRIIYVKWESKYKISINRIEFTFDFNNEAPLKIHVIINDSIYDNLSYYEYIKSIFRKYVNKEAEDILRTDWDTILSYKFDTPLRFTYDGKDFKVEQVNSMEEKNEN